MSGKGTERAWKGSRREIETSSQFPLKAGAAWEARTLGQFFSPSHSLRLNLHGVSEVEFDPCRQLIWTFFGPDYLFGCLH